MHLKEKVKQIIHNYFSFVLPIPSHLSSIMLIIYSYFSALTRLHGGDPPVSHHVSLPPDVATHYQILKNTNYKWFFLCF